MRSDYSATPSEMDLLKTEDVNENPVYREVTY
jgi:hypothetical protein